MAIYLNGENISVGGQVEYYMCNSCSYETFRLQLYTDAAMVYLGIIGLTSIEQNELVITHLTQQEFQNFKNIDKQVIAERINKLFNRTDLAYIENKHFVSGDGDKFLSKACPKCNEQMSKQTYKSLEQFIEDGGKIVTLSIHQKQD